MIVLVLFLSIMLGGSHCLGHSGIPPQPGGALTLTKLTGNTYCIFGRGGNAGFVVTDDGVLMIDDKFEDLAPEIIEKVKSVSSSPIKYLVNTHYHGDHTGGNAVFIRFALIMAHHGVRENMRQLHILLPQLYAGFIEGLQDQLDQVRGKDPTSESEILKQIDSFKAQMEKAREIQAEKVPAPLLTYGSDLKVFLGGEEVRIMHFRRGHTSGDSVVYVPKQKVLYMGDLFFNQIHPLIDTVGGGSSKEWVETLEAVLREVDPSSVVVPGHGEVSNVAGLKKFRQYLVDLRAAVEMAVRQGKTKQQAKDEIRLPGHEAYQATGFRSLRHNVGVVFDEVKNGK